MVLENFASQTMLQNIVPYAIRVNKKTRHIMYPNRQLEDES